MPYEWKKSVMEHLLDDPALKGNMEGAMNMIGAKYVFQFSIEILLLIYPHRAANMLATLKIIREKFGGVETYMIEQCGLTKEDIERIRSNLVIEEPALHQKVQHSL
jgi:hypothetical protein